MKYSFVLMRLFSFTPEPGGTLSAMPIAHAGCEAEKDGVKTLIASGLVVNFGTCVAALKREQGTPVLVQMCFRYDFAQNSSALKPFIDCSCE